MEVNLSSALRYGYDADLDIYSGIVLFRTRSEKELRSMFSLFEPAFDDGKLIYSISIPATNDSRLVYLYFGRNERGLEILKDGLCGLESLLSSKMPELLPKLTLPDRLMGEDHNLVTWTSIVYTIAWMRYKAYLQTELKYQRKSPSSSWVCGENCQRRSTSIPGSD